MIIALDIDEVLADLNPHLTEFLNTTYGHSLTREKYHSWRTEEVLNCTRAEAHEMIYAFYESPYFRAVRPMAGAIEAVKHLGKEHRLIVITARHDALTEQTLTFLKEHFGSSFSEVFFTNAMKPTGPLITKADICVQNNADLLVEDNLEFAFECAEKSIPVLLLDAPWNQSETLPSSIQRVKNWDEIVEVINGSK